MKGKKIINIILSICLFVGCFYLLQKLFMPKYVSQSLEGSMIEEYYDETLSHDVMILGDCEVYENISPMSLWNEYGITSFVRGSSAQMIYQSYYLLEETLKYEKPEIVIFNVLTMGAYEHTEAYNRMTLDGMKMSTSKISSIKASMTKEESMLDYFLPLLRYHSRWSELSLEDIQYMFDKPQITHNGYLMRMDIKPLTSQLPKPKKLANYQFSDESYFWLDKMRELCDNNDIEFVLIKAPSIYPHWYEQWDQQIVDYAQKYDLTYFNYLKDIDKIGIDFSTDTYDSGLHLNYYGAEKLSRYMGKQLVEKFDLKDHRQDQEISEVYNQKYQKYLDMIDDQKDNIEKYGYLKDYGVSKPKSK